MNKPDAGNIVVHRGAMNAAERRALRTKDRATGNVTPSQTGWQAQAMTVEEAA